MIWAVSVTRGSVKASVSRWVDNFAVWFRGSPGSSKERQVPLMHWGQPSRSRCTSRPAGDPARLRAARGCVGPGRGLKKKKKKASLKKRCEKAAKWPTEGKRQFQRELPGWPGSPSQLVWVTISQITGTPWGERGSAGEPRGGQTCCSPVSSVHLFFFFLFTGNRIWQ